MYVNLLKDLDNHKAKANHWKTLSGTVAWTVVHCREDDSENYVKNGLEPREGDDGPRLGLGWR